MKPTHRCTRCGALWTFLVNDTTWTLFSRRCGPCCDNSTMKEMVKPLPITGSLDAGLLHHATSTLMQFFGFGHLPPHLAEVSAPFAELAWVVANGPQNAETTVALRKLLEAKDCAVRAVLLK